MEERCASVQPFDTDTQLETQARTTLFEDGSGPKEPLGRRENAEKKSPPLSQPNLGKRGNDCMPAQVSEQLSTETQASFRAHTESGGAAVMALSLGVDEKTQAPPERHVTADGENKIKREEQSRSSSGQEWKAIADVQGRKEARTLGGGLRSGSNEQTVVKARVGCENVPHWNLRRNTNNVAMTLDQEDTVEEHLHHFAGALQFSGDEDDIHGVAKAEKAGGSEEEKMLSDEANTGTSEEEKNPGADLEKVGGKFASASQKRKSLVSGSSATDGHGQADVVVKKAKKKAINVWAKTSSRKGGKRASKNGPQNPAKEDAVLLAPVFSHQDKLDDEPEQSIVLSKYDKAEKIELTPDRLVASSTKGYRMVRATRGVDDGTWYFEIKIMQLGSTGHTRLGWSTQKGDVQAPVGFDSNSYGYRDIEGVIVHMAERKSYGEPYSEGDVIGFYIHLPNGAELAPKLSSLVSYKGRPYISDSGEDSPKLVPGSEICFFRNGKNQGTAFRDIHAGRYFPAASMYTYPKEPCCIVKFNFGPDFFFPPSDLCSRPEPKAMCLAPYCGEAGREGGSAPWANGIHAVSATFLGDPHKHQEAG